MMLRSKDASRKIEPCMVIVLFQLLFLTTGSVAFPNHISGSKKEDGNAPAMNILVSGHSLTDAAFSKDLQQLFAARGEDIAWELHYLPGSSIRQRLHMLESTVSSGSKSGI